MDRKVPMIGDDAGAPECPCLQFVCGKEGDMGKLDIVCPTRCNVIKEIDLVETPDINMAITETLIKVSPIRLSARGGHSLSEMMMNSQNGMEWCLTRPPQKALVVSSAHFLSWN